jgi:Ca2+-binding RTX toxin-like protein
MPLYDGTSGNDSLTGGSENDSLYGYESNDTLSGGEGNDFLVGGADNDYLDFSFGTGGLFATLADAPPLVATDFYITSTYHGDHMFTPGY